MLMEIMGLHLPGAAFVNPNTPLRDALTARRAKRAVSRSGPGATPTRRSGGVVDERRRQRRRRPAGDRRLDQPHLHLVAMAAAAGIALTWDDFADLAEVTPLLARSIRTARPT
jgi:phosphogluconate dehydratase